MKEMLCSLLVTDRHGGVVVAVALTHRQGHPTGVVAAVPAHCHAVAEDRRTIDAGQAIVNPVKSCGGVVSAVEHKLRVNQSIQFVVQHGVRPVEAEHGHISQVDDAVGIAVDVVTIAVQEIKRSVKDRSEGDAQDPVDDGSASIGVPSSGDYRAIPCDGSRTIGTIDIKNLFRRKEFHEELEEDPCASAGCGDGCRHVCRYHHVPCRGCRWDGCR